MSQLKIDIKQQVRIAIVVITLLLLASCQSLNNSTVINKSTKFDIVNLETNLHKLNKWTASGVIGIRYNGKADSANYVYSQYGEEFSIKLYGPLGIGSVEIKGDDNKVIFIDNKGKKTQANDVESLMVQRLGWYVPVEGLSSWIKGIPVSDKDTNRQIDDNNLTQVLSEGGWEMHYQDYKMFYGKYPLPTKVKMTRDSLYLKIIIKSWQV